MLYIICAFETEARALIDTYRLVKRQSQPFVLFESKEIRLIICKMGQQNAKEACEYLSQHYTLEQEDKLLNLGICAAHENYQIGSLLLVKSLNNQDTKYELQTLDSGLTKVSCYSSEQVLDKPSQSDIAEMEALAIYQSLSPYFQQENISFLKVVSDNFKPFKPNKQFIIDLIRKNIKEIQNHINQLTGNAHA